MVRGFAAIGEGDGTCTEAPISCDYNRGRHVRSSLCAHFVVVGPWVAVGVAVAVVVGKEVLAGCPGGGG